MQSLRHRADGRGDEHRAPRFGPFPTESLDAHRHAEEAGESQGLDVPVGFEVSAQAFGADVDAEHDLRIGPRDRRAGVEPIEE